MPETKSVKPLNLEVQEIERQVRPGCNTSTTSVHCTCRPRPTTM